jgi:hypothetical protein
MPIYAQNDGRFENDRPCVPLPFNLYTLAFCLLLSNFCFLSS